MIVLGIAHATSTAPASAFFAKWIDHSSWPEWSPDTEWVTLDGPVALGAKGELKPAGGPRVKFTVSHYVEGKRYADSSRFPGATLVFDHSAESGDDSTVLRANATMSGPLAFLWARIIGPGFSASVPDDLDRLVKIVEATR
jgi:hypothetical protein